MRVLGQLVALDVAMGHPDWVARWAADLALLSAAEVRAVYADAPAKILDCLLAGHRRLTELLAVDRLMGTDRVHTTLRDELVSTPWLGLAALWRTRGELERWMRTHGRPVHW